MSEDAKTICEKCESSIKRVITGGTGLIFKGSGFYLTDYKNEPKLKVDKKSTVKKDKKSNE
jgi:predicted nucleic acid-binding Zn ribbon protein